MATVTRTQTHVRAQTPVIAQTHVRTQTPVIATAANMLDQYVQDVDAHRLTQDQRIQRLSAIVLRSIEEGEAANRVKAFAFERIAVLEEELHVQKIAIILAGAAFGGLLGGAIGLGFSVSITGVTTATIVTNTAIGAGIGIGVGTATGHGVNCYRDNSRHTRNLEHLRRAAQGGVQ